MRDTCSFVMLKVRLTDLETKIREEYKFYIKLASLDLRAPFYYIFSDNITNKS